jgi:adenosylcobinamide kinase/adenosylcobinamide-phosphate guanylyltransferase
MDIQLILGPNNSGKSLLAEKLVVETKNLYRIYLATMIPQTQENNQRIQKHILQREGKGFNTIEEPWNIHTLDFPKDSVVLLEDASNLLANGIFMHHSNVEECYQRIITLANACQKLIIVNIDGLTEGNYDEETNNYIFQLNQLNQMLESIAANCIKLS